MIYCFIISTNPVYIDVLTNYIDKAFGVILLGVDNCMKSSVNKIRTFFTKPDYIFVDSTLLSGLNLKLCDILKEISSIISISTTKEEAFNAYECEAFDFILLPSTYIRFLRAISKPKIANGSNERRDYFFVKLESKCKLYKILHEELIYIEALHNYVKIYTNHGVFVTYSTLKVMEESLPKNRFIRVHRSFIINLTHLRKVNGPLLILEQGNEIPLGNKYSDFFNYSIREIII